MKHVGKLYAGDDTDRSSRAWIIALSIVLAISIGTTVWALFFKVSAPMIAPDYAPQATEKNAEPLDDDGSEKMEQQEGGGAVSLTYAKKVTVDLSEKTVELMFANPQKSNQDMLLQIVIHDIVIAQSELLLPGYQVTMLDLENSARLSAGEYEGKIVVNYYQPDSYEKAMLNTEIPLTVKVEE